MMDERTATAAILGQLIPQLEYAAPVLLDRLERGLPLVEQKSPTDLGFDTGTIDSGTLELFRVLAPYVTAALSSGLFVIIQSKSLAELRAALAQLRTENARLRLKLDSIADVVSTRVKGPVPQSYVDDAITSAIEQLSQYAQ
jgi:hypothetical protein